MNKDEKQLLKYLLNTLTDDLVDGELDEKLNKDNRYSQCCSMESLTSNKAEAIILTIEKQEIVKEK